MSTASPFSRRLATGCALLAVFTIGFAAYSVWTKRRAESRNHALVRATEDYTRARDRIDPGTPDAPDTHLHSAPRAATHAPEINSPPPTDENAQALEREMQRGSARRNYASLFREFALPPEKITSFVDTAVQFHLERTKLLATATTDAATRAALQADSDSLQRRRITALGALLGPRGEAALTDFERSGPLRLEVSTLADLLHGTSDALTPERSRQMLALLSAWSQPSGNQLTLPPQSWESIYREAATFLSPVQLETLKTLREHQELWRQVNRQAWLANRPTTGSR